MYICKRLQVLDTPFPLICTSIHPVDPPSPLRANVIFERPLSKLLFYLPSVCKNQLALKVETPESSAAFKSSETSELLNQKGNNQANLLCDSCIEHP